MQRTASSMLTLLIVVLGSSVGAQETPDVQIQAQEVAAGKNRDEVVAANPTAPWDEAWGGGFLGADVFAGIAFDSAQAESE